MINKHDLQDIIDSGWGGGATRGNIRIDFTDKPKRTTTVTKETRRYVLIGSTSLHSLNTDMDEFLVANPEYDISDKPYKSGYDYSVMMYRVHETGFTTIL